MSEFGNNPINDMLRPVVEYANQKHEQWGKVGLGLAAVGLLAASTPVAIAGGMAFFGSKIYERIVAPKLNQFLDEASQESTLNYNVSYADMNLFFLLR